MVSFALLMNLLLPLIDPGVSVIQYCRITYLLISELISSFRTHIINLAEISGLKDVLFFTRFCLQKIISVHGNSIFYITKGLLQQSKHS